MDEAIVLRAWDGPRDTRFLHLLCHNAGPLRAVVGVNKGSKYSFQRGSRVKVDWLRVGSRAPMKSVGCEPIVDLPHSVFSDISKVLAVDLLLGMLSQVLPEGEPVQALYIQVADFFAELSGETFWYQKYIEVLLLLMQCIGIPIQLGRCAHHPITKERIGFVCLETGRGFCEEAAKGQKAVYPVTEMIRNAFDQLCGVYGEPSLSMFSDSLKLFKHFLHTHSMQSICSPSLDVLCNLLDE